MALTKEEIIEAVAEDTGFPKNQSGELIEIIKKTLVSGDDVLVSRFGKFRVREKKTRKGRNPATGEDMTLESRRVVTFKCSGRLRDKIHKSQ
jgi:integration host factor subunit alpha